jgi:hypothetical protein
MVAQANHSHRANEDGASASLSQQVGAENTLRVRICTDSGMLATPYCPHVVSREYLSGQQPSERCTIHKKPAEAARPRREQVADQSDNGDDSDTPRRHRRHRRPARQVIDQPPLETNGADSAGGTSGTSAATDDAPAPRRHRRHRTRAPAPEAEPGGNGDTGTDQ